MCNYGENVTVHDLNQYLLLPSLVLLSHYTLLVLKSQICLAHVKPPLLLHLLGLITVANFCFEQAGCDSYFVLASFSQAKAIS